MTICMPIPLKSQANAVAQYTWALARFQCIGEGVFQGFARLETPRSIETKFGTIVHVQECSRQNKSHENYIRGFAFS
jgi:hypothetical protein